MSEATVRSAPSGIGAVGDWLSALRENDRYRRVALGCALVVGVGLASVHWTGLVVAGALVGLTRRTLARAVLSGLAFGVAVLAGFLLVTPAVGPAELLSLRPVGYLTVALAVVAPAWGALVRGIA